MVLRATAVEDERTIPVTRWFPHTSMGGVEVNSV